MVALDVVATLATHPNISQMTFARYTPAAPGASRARSLTGDDRLRALLRSSSDDYFEVATSRIQRWGLEAIRRPASSDETIALCSTVGTVGDRLLLLDFSAPVSADNTAEILACARILGWRGWLLASGNSYHWIGAEPLTVDAWCGAMASALLLPVPIDVRYMGLSMRRGVGAARLFACVAKPTEPYVVGEVNRA